MPRNRQRFPSAPFVTFILLSLMLSGCGGGSKTTAPTTPSCQLSASAVDFGAVQVGQNATRTLEVRNAGGGTLDGSLSLSCAEFAIEGPTSYSLGAGQSQVFTLRYAPASDVAGACDLSTGCGTVHLSGNGQAPPYEVVLTLVDFGRRTPNQLGGFAIFNNGTSRLTGTVSSACPNFQLVDDFAHDVPSIAYDIAPGDNYNIGISFRPTMAGPQSCPIQTGLPAYPTVTCTGIGQACAVSPTELYLGTAWHWIDQQFTIANNDSFALSGAVSENYSEISIAPSTSYSLGPGAEQTFTVRWSPQLPVPVGAHVYLVNTGVGTCTDVRVDANGDPVDALTSGGCIGIVNGQVFDFGTLHVNQSATLPLQLVNGCGSSEDPFQVNFVEFSGSLTVSPPAFSGVGGGETRTAQVTFTPTEPGEHHIRVQIYSGNPHFANRARGQAIYRAVVLP